MLPRTFLDRIAIFAPTIPLVRLVVVHSGIGVDRLGAMIGVALEMALISPPVGINVIMVQGIAEHAPSRCFHTKLPGLRLFWFIMQPGVVPVGLALQLSLFMPNTMIRYPGSLELGPGLEFLTARKHFRYLRSVSACS